MNDYLPIHVLIIEDDDDDYFLLESTLKELSFLKKITWAKSYNKAIEYIQQESFDIILVDYRLGVHNGIELIGFVNKYSPFTPTILLTGYIESTIDQQALKYGVYDYLAKDQYTTESLSRSIRYAIERSKVLKSLKESENRFKNLFENAVEYVFLIDSDYHIIDVNKAALNFFNYSEKFELIGKKIIDYISINVHAGNNFFNETAEVEFFVLEQKKKCNCIMNLTTVDIEKNLHQLVLHDITERKINEQKEKMLEKQALTGKVARVIAHEIKNPLTNIHLAVLELRSILNGAVLTNHSDNPDDFISIIERNGKRINALIEDLMQATRFDTLNMKQVLLEEVVEDAIFMVQDRIKLKDIKFEKAHVPQIVILADKEKLAIALLNILINAIEAVEEKTGKLQLEILQANNDNHIQIIINDNGVGIAAADLDKLFEPFFTSKKGGTGLGLTASYNIITKHDGTIRVQSELGKGTTFYITLPEYSLSKNN